MNGYPESKPSKTQRRILENERKAKTVWRTKPFFIRGDYT